MVPSSSEWCSARELTLALGARSLQRFGAAVVQVQRVYCLHCLQLVIHQRLVHSGGWCLPKSNGYSSRDCGTARALHHSCTIVVKPLHQCAIAPFAPFAPFVPFATLAPEQTLQLASTTGCAPKETPHHVHRYYRWWYY